MSMLCHFGAIPFGREGKFLLDPWILEPVQTGHFPLIFDFFWRSRFGNDAHLYRLDLNGLVPVLCAGRGPYEEDEEDGRYCFHDLRLLHYYNYRKRISGGSHSLKNSGFSLSGNDPD